jgi:type VII secretion-associated serine protease mycosin
MVKKARDAREVRVRMTRAVLATVMAAIGSGMATLGFASPASADWVRNDQWQLNSLHAATAWTESTGSGVIVAVLDSGVDANHVDLMGQVLPGADFVDGSTDGRKDPVGHGTTVAAFIAGRADDAGVEGVAPRAKILPVRVLDAQNRYKDAANVAKALRWAVDHGADVVNMSLGGWLRSPALAAAIDYAYKHNVVIVACTGNQATTADPTTVAAGPTSPRTVDPAAAAPLATASGTSGQVTSGSSDAPGTIWYPAREPGVVAVAGLAESGGGDGDEPTLWSGTLTGPDTVLVAPAVNMLGAKPGGYWRVQGTSFAAPLVSATAALIRARWPGMDAANVINRLISTADDLGPPGRDDQYGFGEVDPVAALTDPDIPTVTRNPLLPDPAASPTAAALDRTVPAKSSTTTALALSAVRPVLWGVAAGGSGVLASIGIGVFLYRRRFT